MLSPELIARLPTPKGVALALTQACRRDDVNVQKIADLVRTDPALCGRLLTVANAAAYGGRSVMSIDGVIARIGLNAVVQVALAFSLIDQHGTGACANFNYAGFWSRSLLMAAAAKQFGTVRRLGNPGDLFTLGLLAQVGCLALATAFAGEYSAQIARNLEPAERVRQERALAGMDHLALSVALMERWGVPAEDARSFGRYEGPDSGDSDGGQTQPERAKLAHTAWQVALALSEESVQAVFERPACLASLEWLQLSHEALMPHLEEIESTWLLWLTLIAR